MNHRLVACIASLTIRVITFPLLPTLSPPGRKGKRQGGHARASVSRARGRPHGRRPLMRRPGTAGLDECDRASASGARVSPSLAEFEAARACAEYRRGTFSSPPDSRLPRRRDCSEEQPWSRAGADTKFVTVDARFMSAAPDHGVPDSPSGVDIRSCGTNLVADTQERGEHSHGHDLTAPRLSKAR